MRLTFPNGEHAAVDIEHGQTGVGSAAGGGTTVTIAGLAPLHAVFAAGRRGYWLTVPKDAIVIVNARPVKRIAYLRPGDLVCLGGVHVRLQSVASPPVPQTGLPLTPPRAPVGSSRAALRGLSGTWFGRCVPLGAVRILGSAAGCDVRIDGVGVMERHAQAAIEDGDVVVRALAPGAILRVNGHPVRAAVLAAGDQIEVGDQRFVLESAGGKAAVARIEAASSKSPADTVAIGSSDAGLAAPSGPARAQRDLGGIYLLVAAAAALAAALTAFFVYAPR